MAALLLGALLTGCSDDASGPPSSDPRSSTDGAGRGDPVTAPDVARGLTRALARRADSVRRGDEAAFLAGVDARATAFHSAQSAYFANLVALPLGEFGYRLDRGSLVRDGEVYWAVVDVTLELEGFDSEPVVTRDRYRFAAGRGGRYLLSSMTDRAWERAHHIDPQPWEAGPLTVRTGAGTLGIFDAGSAPSADRVMADVASGIAGVSAELPYAWDHRVVVYALSDPDFLSRLDNVPGGDALALDAVTFPVPAAPGSRRTAAIRFVLNPRVLAEPDVPRGRLIRHELTHVALGDRQDGVPTWFAEGLAEYVSVRPLAPEARAVPAAALAAARTRPTTLPDDDTFNGPQSQAHYGLAWWACEYLAATYDESVLWLLLDAMKGADGDDEVLQNVLQLDEKTLARKSARLLLNTYDPEPSEDPEPRDDPSDGPSDDPSSSDPGDDPRSEPGGDEPSDEKTG